MIDRRVDEDEVITKHLRMMSAAFMVSPDKLGAYAVEHNGALYTAIGWQRSETTLVPLCLLLTEPEWLSSPQKTHTHRPSREQ